MLLAFCVLPHARSLPAAAATLEVLLDGATLNAANLKFSSWELVSLDSNQSVAPDLSLITVTPFNADPATPGFQLNGNGQLSIVGMKTIDLSLKFRVDPQVVASLEGQGGNADLKGLGVPIVIAGPWAAPKIYPDIKGILENPAQAYEQLRELGGGLVSLPGLDQLGKKAGINGATGSVPLQGIIKDGKVNKDALRQGLNALINKQKSPKQTPPVGNAAVTPPAQPAAPPAAQPPPTPPAQPSAAPAAEQPAPPAAPNQKAKKKKQKPEDVAKQLMQELLLGNQ